MTTRTLVIYYDTQDPDCRGWAYHAFDSDGYESDVVVDTGALPGRNWSNYASNPHLLNAGVRLARSLGAPRGFERGDFSITKTRRSQYGEPEGGQREWSATWTVGGGK